MMTIDDYQLVELENKALRFQNETQAQMLQERDKELFYLRRFKNLVDRAGYILDKLVDGNISCYNGPHGKQS